MWKKEVTLNKYMLQPGYIYVAKAPTLISTVLGSCVSVVLYDKKKKIGGMNHFRYPYVKERSKMTPVFGNVSTYALINIMLENGSKIKNMIAHLFGGARNPDISDVDIGKENAWIAKKILIRKGIEIVSEDIGGTFGRKIVFNTSNGEIIVLKVERLRRCDWYPYQGQR